MKNMKADLTWFAGAPVYFPESSIGLPTQGFTVYGMDCAGKFPGQDVLFYSIHGAIHPVDPKAPDIVFQVNLPVSWNGTAVQYGGGGFDGALETAAGPCPGEDFTGTPPAARGYVTFGSDGGHRSAPGNDWDASFGLCDEALRNFATESLKKTRDAALAIVQRSYGTSPEYIYFAGGSNGGREALRAIHDYPDDYDGAIILYPVLNWIGKAILDNRNTNYMTASRERWISPEDWKRVRTVIRSHLCRANAYGTVLPVPFPDKAACESILHEVKDILTPAQLKTLLLFAEPVQLPYPLADGTTTVPGYGVLDGADLSDRYFNQFPSRPCVRDGFMSQFSDGVIRYSILRDPDADPQAFDPVSSRSRVQAASALLDAGSPDFDRFFAHGGKIILLHGTCDQLVSMYSTIRLVRAMQARYREQLDASLRFYLVPGYGHGIGEDFTLSRALLTDLGRWTAEGIAPEELEVSNQTPGGTGGRQLLHPAHADALEQSPRVLQEDASAI